MSFPADMGSFRRVRPNASFLNHLSGIGGAHAQGEMRPGVRQAEFEASAEEVEAERLWRVERWHDRDGDKGMSGARCRALVQPEPAALSALGRRLLGADKW